MNDWKYVEGNPINYRDPSGYIKEGDARKADSIVKWLEAKSIRIIKDWGNNYVFDPNTYKVNVCGWKEGVWKLRELELIKEAANDLDKKLNGKIAAAVGLASVNKIPKNSTAMAPPGILSNMVGDILYLTDATSTNEDWYKHSFVHEFGHVWDYRTGNSLSLGLMIELGTWICVDNYVQDPISKNFYNRPYCHWDPYHDSGNSTYPEPPPDTNKACAHIPPGPNNTLPGCKDIPYSSTYGNGGRLFTKPGAEDWANSLAYYVYDSYHLKYNQIGLQPIRRRYVESQINSLP